MKQQIILLFFTFTNLVNALQLLDEKNNRPDYKLVRHRFGDYCGISYQLQFKQNKDGEDIKNKVDKVIVPADAFNTLVMLKDLKNASNVKIITHGTEDDPHILSGNSTIPLLNELLNTEVEILKNKKNDTEIRAATINMRHVGNLFYNYWNSSLSRMQRHPGKFMFGGICIGFTLGFGLGYYKDPISTTWTGLFALPELLKKLR